MAEFSEEIKSKFPNERVKAMLNIKFTANYLDNIGSSFLKPFNISEQQYNILRILRGAKKAITVKTIKERMVQKSPNSTRLMDKLCDKGLIDRMRCENDRRVVYVEINDKGLALLNKINIEEMDTGISTISNEDAKLLNDLLDKFRENDFKSS
ncbi:DNA-binding transcriptional regulator, MarR family [Lutibacter oricola]|uniref:DNA-binding transcriptional regulator, MarR family n=1 Tax=Lutibacter oricola TaxID=762486 RepID=A0A1H3C610_9FLAO|nr:MarR family transcriptional regulator [Lutibacter oricola]SDX49597.1 DNA-binding transcriptional regulator, MarR family [Lutibacter oricola]